MRQILISLLVLLSWTAEAQLLGGGRRGVVIIQGGGGGDSTAAPLTSTRIATALGYVPLNPNVPVSDPAWIQSISKTKVGLGNVDNTSDANKPLSNAIINALLNKQDALEYTPVNVAGTYTDPSFISSLSKAKVGLGNVDNTSDLNKPLSTAMTNALNGKQASLGYTPASLTGAYADPSWITSLSKSKVGLANVDNTSDLNKPISSAVATALATKQASLPVGSTTQYLRGDGTLATFPDIPSTNGFVTTTGDQTGIAGNKTATGTWAFNAAPTMAGATLSSTLSAQNITFPANGTYNIGTSATRGATAYFNAFVGGSGTTTFGTGTGTGTVAVRKGASGVNSMVIDGASSRVLFQKPSANLNYDAEFMTIDGGVSIKGGIATNPDSIQTFATNSAAIAGGVKPGKVYKTVTSDGEWLMKIAHATGQVAAPTIAPVYSQNITTGTQNTSTLTFDGTASRVQWMTQTPNKAWSMTKASNKTIPFYRFEVRPEDWWSGDYPSDGTTPTSGNSNWQNGGVKERSEFYQKEPETTPLDVPIWTSWSFLIEGDPTIDALNPAGNAFDKYGAIFYGEPTPNKDFLCALGQWHGSPPSGAPHWALDLNTVYGKDSIYLNTVGGTVSGSGTTKVKASFPITRNVWHNVVVRAVHSNDVNVPNTADGVNGGQISLWVDGKLIYEGTNISMGYTNGSDAGYMKFGIYRTRITSTRATRTAVQYANMEISTSDLTSRITNPLPLD